MEGAAEVLHPFWEKNMILRVPSYYKEFRCIADRCKDSCCIGWEIDIDEDTFSYYKNVGGAFGERLRDNMVTEECNSFTLAENGWCPFLNEKKLCDICIELGEEALCEVCTEFPRFTMEYENVREKVLSLSCEEVGRLVFSSDKKIAWEEFEVADEYDGEWKDDISDEEASENDDIYDEEEEVPVPAGNLEKVRARAIEILQNRTKPIFERAAEYLLYCERMQQKLYGCHPSATSGEMPEEKRQEKADDSSTVTSAPGYHDFLARMEVYEQLEVLDETWTHVKGALRMKFSEKNYRDAQKAFLKDLGTREYEYEHLLVYFTNRYFMRSYYDANILNKAKFAVVSVLVIRDMDVLRYLQNGGNFTADDRIDTARIYSKEVEHSEENMELLADDLQFEEVFETARLIEQL